MTRGPIHNYLMQAYAAEQLMAEYRRRLQEAGFTLGEGADYDAVTHGPHPDAASNLELASRIWADMNAVAK